MGFSAAKNVSVLIRQTIFNGFYALLDFKTFTPFPVSEFMIHSKLYITEIISMFV